MGYPIFGEGLVNGLVWKFCGQEGKEGLVNNYSLPFLDNLEGMKLENLSRGTMNYPIS